MQPELSHLSLPCSNNLDSSLDEVGVYVLGMDGDLSNYDFSPFTTTDVSSDVFLKPHFPTMFSDEFMNFNVHIDELQVSLPAVDFSVNLEEFNHILSEDMEINNQLSLNHLAMAYGEATDKEQTLLAEIFPPGRIAHFRANSAIFEAMPHDVETIHIVDFDIGEGIQWSSMIEAIGQQEKQGLPFQQKALRVTSIKWREEIVVVLPHDGGSSRQEDLEARTIMECPFVAPYVSSPTWVQKWEEIKGGCENQSRLGLEGWSVSQERLMEAQELVREWESLYEVSIKEPPQKSSSPLSPLKMMQPELSQISLPCFNSFDFDTSLDEVGIYGLGMDADLSNNVFSPPFTATEDSFDVFPIPHFPAMSSDELLNFPVHFDELQVAFSTDDFSLNLEEFERISSDEIEDMRECLESEGSFSLPQISIEGEDEFWSLSPSVKSSDMSLDVSLIKPSLILPTEDMEIDNQQSLNHLAQAYRDAMEMEHTELAEVIMRRVGEKANPIGEIVERLLYYLFLPSDKQADYLEQESARNFDAAFKAVYQIFPYGRFAHFRANSAIIEAMPHDAETIHIVDFDIVEGVQWSTIIEAIGQQQQQSPAFQQKALRFTSIKWREENCDRAPSRWRFEDTKRRLFDHARSFGLKVKVEEMELQDLVAETKKMKKRGGRREWYAFNCMVGLPHMGRGRSRRHVMEFLRVAKELIANSAYGSTSNRGIIILGDGDAYEKLKNCSGFGSFFDGCLVHYQTLLESMQWSFPIQLAEGRTTMECLFVAPYISSPAWTQKWEETKEVCKLQSGFGLEGWRVNHESLMEAQELVREGESLYGVRIEGDSKNEMVLEWRGTPLVSVSTWR
ncbi:hypothetical protein L1049_008008 [Liquidambar formosana]|uniref:Nodulation-signaling pathway 2 protein-like n=1 Tax=Liquidambar formosana TaxID=63359 RepID=A0AAP0S2V3_LIQFO